MTNHFLENFSDIYLTVYGMIRSDRVIIRGSCVDGHVLHITAMCALLKHKCQPIFLRSGALVNPKETTFEVLATKTVI